MLWAEKVGACLAWQVYWNEVGLMSLPPLTLPPLAFSGSLACLPPLPDFGAMLFLTV